LEVFTSREWRWHGKSERACDAKSHLLLLALRFRFKMNVFQLFRHLANGEWGVPGKDRVGFGRDPQGSKVKVRSKESFASHVSAPWGFVSVPARACLPRIATDCIRIWKVCLVGKATFEASQGRVKEHSSRASSLYQSFLGQHQWTELVVIHDPHPKTVLFRMSRNGFVQTGRSRSIVIQVVRADVGRRRVWLEVFTGPWL
jgi:hypothetical protein